MNPELDEVGTRSTTESRRDDDTLRASRYSSQVLRILRDGQFWRLFPATSGRFTVS